MDEIAFGRCWNGKFSLSAATIWIDFHANTHTHTFHSLQFFGSVCACVSAAIHRPSKLFDKMKRVKSWKCRLTFHANSHNRCDILRTVHIQHIAYFATQTTYSTVSVFIWLERDTRHRWMAAKCGKSHWNIYMHNSVDQTNMNASEFCILHLPFDAMIFLELNIHSLKMQFLFLLIFIVLSYVKLFIFTLTQAARRFHHFHIHCWTGWSSCSYDDDDDEKCMRETTRLRNCDRLGTQNDFPL